MRVLLVLLLAFVVFTAATSITQVQPGERAVVKRFGRILDEKPGPGLFFGLPWGFDQVERVSVGRVRNVQVGWSGKEPEDDAGPPPGQVLTGDHNLVNVQAEIQYKVDEARLEQYVLNADRIDGLIAVATETALAEWAAAWTIDDILLRGKAALPAWLQQRVQERVAGYDVGVQIMAANTRLETPAEVKAHFDEVSQAHTKKDTLINQAAQYADSRLRETQSDIFRIERRTASYANNEISQARGDAEAFLRRQEQYQKLLRQDPTYLTTLWQDEMTRLFARMKDAGRLDVLDHYLAGEGLNITSFPLMPKKK